MSITKVVKRFYLHSFRHRTVVGLAIFLYVALIFGMAMFYPGEDALIEFIQLMSFLGDFPTENPGFALWLIFFCGFSLSLYLPVAGIFLGSNLLPINEKDGKEILFTTPKSLTTSFLENSFVAVILIGLIALPSYIVSLGFLYINNAWDAVPNITICFTLAIMLVTAIVFITAFGCTINFSKSTGYKIGGLYIVFSIIIDLTANQIDDIGFIRQLSLFSQAKVVNNSLLGTWNEEFILTIIALVVLLIVASVILLYRKDFLEIGVQQQTIAEESEQSDQEKQSRIFSRIRTPVDKILGRLGWKFPAVRDQLHSSANVFIIFLGFMVFYSLYVMSMYQEEEIAELLGSFNMPFMQALLFGNSLMDLPINLETYLAFEIFSFAFMIIAPFILIVIYDIIIRDYKKNYAEITWTFPKTGSKIFFERTVAALLYFIIVILASMVTLLFMQVVSGNFSDLGQTLYSYLVFIWGYCVIFVFFLSLTLLVPSRHALKTLIIGYVFFVLIIFIAFLPGTDFTWMRFLSPFGYFDFISLILDQRTFTDIFPEAIIGTLLTLVFYFIVLKKRIPSKDHLI